MTIDLTENKIPFGLLSKEEQERLENWPHGLRVLGSSIVGRPIWERADLTSKLNTTSVYRTIPAPKRGTVWVYLDDKGLLYSCKNAETILGDKGGFAFRIEYDAETGDNPTIVKETFDG